MIDDIRLRIGRQIADLRSQKGMTQQQLADAAGITRVHVSRVESGKYSVGLDILAKIANALDVRVGLISSNSI